MLAARAPRVPVIDALHDVPDYGIEPAAHLLAALAGEYPADSVFLAVVDPGVGGRREAIVVEASGRRFVGPDNGLLSVLWQRARRRRCWRIAWRPKRLSPSFHGRDLFAPVAAALATGRAASYLKTKKSLDVMLDGADLAQIIYIDHYGNAVTGLRFAQKYSLLKTKGHTLRFSPTFEDASGPFWHVNSMGLVEIAMPRGSAANRLRLRIGSKVRFDR